MSSHDTEPLLEQEASTLNTQNNNPSRTRVSRSYATDRLKRCLMSVFLVICTVIMLLYWRQPSAIDFKSAFMRSLEVEKMKAGLEMKASIEDHSIEGIEADVDTIDPEIRLRDIEPLWTWICRNNSCERKSASNSTIVQHLSTCNMMCGSTQLWPQPTGPVSLSSTIVPVHSDKFTLQVDESPSKDVTEHLKDAFALFKDDLRNLELGSYSYNKSLPLGVMHDVIVRVFIDKDGDPRLRLNTDESYHLVLKAENNTSTAVITAHSFCGARNGLETLSQLVWSDPYVGSLVAVEVARVMDAPKFKYRGLLLDTSRNFFPVKDIIRTIDAMSANKLNTFHWHATDSQSFPLMLKSAPQLAQHGAYGPAAIYTTDDIKTIVRRARLRGIRVVIEIDAPAHVGSAFSWGPTAGLGDLAYCIELDPWNRYCGEPPCGQLNPNNTHVYELMEKIYAEIIELTGVKDIFHLGGDEVNAPCWQKHIQFSNANNLWLEFMKEALKALERANGGTVPELTMIWSSTLTQVPYLNQLSQKQFAVQLWGASDWPDQRGVLDSGFRSIISHVNAWYLDCGVGSWRDSSFGHCGLYRKWWEVYQHRPWTDHPTNRWRIEGGVACQWTEMLGPEGLDTRLWPRGVALAERLWSDPDHNVMNDVRMRIDTQRSRMMARGIGAEPLWPRWCTQNPTACVS